MEKLITFAVTRVEGGYWEPFIKHQRPDDHEGLKVHAIMFEDGSVWDACNGWRPPSEFQGATPASLRSLWSEAQAIQTYIKAQERPRLS